MTAISSTYGTVTGTRSEVSTCLAGTINIVTTLAVPCDNITNSITNLCFFLLIQRDRWTGEEQDGKTTATSRCSAHPLTIMTNE